jgi:hypothetical protein
LRAIAVTSREETISVRIAGLGGRHKRELVVSNSEPQPRTLKVNTLPLRAWIGSNYVEAKPMAMSKKDAGKSGAGKVKAARSVAAPAKKKPAKKG